MEYEGQQYRQLLYRGIMSDGAVYTVTMTAQRHANGWDHRAGMSALMNANCVAVFAPEAWSIYGQFLEERMKEYLKERGLA